MMRRDSFGKKAGRLMWASAEAVLLAVVWLLVTAVGLCLVMGAVVFATVIKALPFIVAGGALLLLARWLGIA